MHGNDAISIYTLTGQVVTISLAIVYVYGPEKWLLRESLFPCYQTLKSVDYAKRLAAATVLIRSISFKCILFVLEEPLYEEKNKRKISLSLYIRLEYRYSRSVKTTETLF